MKICINGKFVNEHEAKISVFDRGVLYGDGIFETIPASDGKLFWAVEHINRLLWCCKNLRIDLPWSKKQLLKFSELTLLKNHHYLHEKLRLIITRGTSHISNGSEDIRYFKPNLIIFNSKNTLPDSRSLQNGIKLMTTHELRPYPEIKTLNFIPSVLGQVIAQKNGFDDVLFINDKNEVLEGGRFNIFIVKKRTLKTSSHGVLKGITAEKVITMARNLGFSAKKTSIKIKELQSCDEMFATGTTKRILPIVQVDKIVIGNGKVGSITKQLINKFSEIYF